jgi:hypothetical protein
MKKAQRHELILHKAEKYARSGRFSNWLSIEWELRSEGLKDARLVLDNEHLRVRLDDLCRKANSAAKNDTA